MNENECQLQQQQQQQQQQEQVDAKNIINVDDDDDDDDDVIVLENYESKKKFFTPPPLLPTKTNDEIIDLLSTEESSLSTFSAVVVGSSSSSSSRNDILVNFKTVNHDYDIHHEAGVQRGGRSDSESDSGNGNGSGSATENENENKHGKITIYFLHKGRTMSRSRIELLEKVIHKKKRGSNSKKTSQLEILTNFEKDVHDILPHYIIVDASLTLKSISSGLGFQSVDEMVIQYKKNCHRTSIVTPDWVIKTKSVFDRPTMDQQWPGMFELKQKVGEKKPEKRYTSNSSEMQLKGKRKINEVARMAFERNNKMTVCQTPRTIPAMNMKISALFQKISNLYEEMPLEKDDEWRSFTYNAAAARLRCLDFEVCIESLQMLSKRKGFGKKIMKQIKEILNTGNCELIAQFEHDTMRLNVRNMINIWGIGTSKAVELVKLGFTDISSVRRALGENQIQLHETIRVGVQYYEEFQEKLDRSEVKQIGDIVAKAFQKYFPDAEINIVGSYRRGNEKCGDVDILITHPKFVTCVPEGAVDELVERLRDEGYISDHLTFVDPSHKEALPLRADNLDDILLHSSQVTAKYMGVFVSPLNSKHRRIDIRFYPYREKAFATLFFTGNNWFHRAMRWYARSKREMKLNDTGLFKLTVEEEKKFSREGKRVKATSEKEIFERLGLVYQEPHQREAFNAIIPKDGSDFDIGLNQKNFQME